MKKGFIKRTVAAVCSLALMAGMMVTVTDQASAASITWNNKSISVSTDNATVKIRANATAKGKWSSASGTIRDASGKVVASKSEGANHSTSYMNIWYDVKGEMGKSLKPGTKYTVQFTATYNGTTYKSPSYGFTTKAASSGTSNAGGKVSQFLSDSRWRDGAAWGDSQKPKLSSYSSKGCCAYCADFAKYVFGKNSPRDGAAFTSTSEIRANDILEVSGHWMVVLSRSGNTLKVAEGNVVISGARKVQVSSDKWTISGNALKNKYESSSRKLLTGYHFN